MRLRAAHTVQTRWLWYKGIRRLIFAQRTIRAFRRQALVGKIRRGLLRVRLAVVVLQSLVRQKRVRRRFLRDAQDQSARVRRELFDEWKRRSVSLVRRAVVWNDLVVAAAARKSGSTTPLSDLSFLRKVLSADRTSGAHSTKYLNEERTLLASALRAMQKRGIHLEGHFTSHGLPKGSKKRKRTMVKLLFETFERADASAAAVLASIDGVNSDDSSALCALKYRAQSTRLERLSFLRSRIASVAVDLYRAIGVACAGGVAHYRRNRSRSLIGGGERSRGLCETRMIFERQSSLAWKTLRREETRRAAVHAWPTPVWTRSRRFSSSTKEGEGEAGGATKQ
eukprot:g3447.t1